MRVYFKTFGCRVNQYEGELIRERALANGAVAIADFESADLCVLNTCTVTREADKEALQLLRRIARRNPAARLVVTGCYATRAPEEILRAAPAALIVSNEKKDHLPALLGCRPVPDETLGSFGERSRAFIKVQDGCNMHCTYCIIPSVRPSLSCKPYAIVEHELRRLMQAGYPEVVLCGIRLGRYLAEENGRRVDFVGLLERLLAISGNFRIRLSSLEITDVTERFLDLFSRFPGKLCPSFHLPLQSGCDPVLKRMQRWYSVSFYARRIEALRLRCPQAGIFTDTMAGFPGETRAYFEESLAFVRDQAFSGLHVFRYSKRNGTPAARFTDQVPENEVLERARLLRDLDGELRSAFAASSVGSKHQVVAESQKGVIEALTGNFLRVFLDHNPGPGLFLAKVLRSQGPLAYAVVL